jgi:hypothetical protein
MLIAAEWEKNRAGEGRAAQSLKQVCLESLLQEWCHWESLLHQWGGLMVAGVVIPATVLVELLIHRGASPATVLVDLLLHL